MSGEKSIMSELDLRYMQVHFNLHTGSQLPGSGLPDHFLNSEFITMIGKSEHGMLCYVKFEFIDPKVLRLEHAGLEIVEIKCACNIKILNSIFKIKILSYYKYLY